MRKDKCNVTRQAVELVTEMNKLEGSKVEMAGKIKVDLKEISARVWTHRAGQSEEVS